MTSTNPAIADQLGIEILRVDQLGPGRKIVIYDLEHNTVSEVYTVVGLAADTKRYKVIRVDGPFGSSTRIKFHAHRIELFKGFETAVAIKGFVADVIDIEALKRYAASHAPA